MPMPSYAAFVGHQPTLSITELSARLPDMKIVHNFENQFVVFSTEQKIDQNFLQTLGGTVLLAREVPGGATATFAQMPTLLLNEMEGAKGKHTFALRFLGLHRSKGRELYRMCKDLLKQNGKSSRYVGNENQPAQAIQLHDEGLMEKSGCELVILKDKHHQWIGKTIAAQNVKAYTMRDMEKPVRDVTVGLLPPKLAQMMLNLGWYMANTKAKKQLKTLTVFDPFCGTGVIPMEAMLLRWNVLASDVSLKAVNGCTKNIEWVRKTYKILKKDSDATIWKQDATKAFELKELPDVIVTEGSLGPALMQRPTLKESDTMLKDSERLEKEFLENCAKTLPGVPVVMMWPVWYTQKRPQFLDKALKIATDLGYTPVLPPHISPASPERFTLIYRRPDQYVGREIVMLMPK